jgi:hypothetical protein
VQDPDLNSAYLPIDFDRRTVRAHLRVGRVKPDADDGIGTHRAGLIHHAIDSPLAVLLPVLDVRGRRTAADAHDGAFQVADSSACIAWAVLAWERSRRHEEKRSNRTWDVIGARRACAIVNNLRTVVAVGGEEGRSKAASFIGLF